MKLLTVSQFAEAMPAMTENAIRHRVDRGSMPGVKRIGKRVYIDWDAFVAEVSGDETAAPANGTQVARKRARKPGWEL